MRESIKRLIRALNGLRNAAASGAPVEIRVVEGRLVHIELRNAVPTLGFLLCCNPGENACEPLVLYFDLRQSKFVLARRGEDYFFEDIQLTQKEVAGVKAAWGRLEEMAIRRAEKELAGKLAQFV